MGWLFGVWQTLRWSNPPRRVRAMTPTQLRLLVERAEAMGFKYRGSLPWVRAHGSTVRRAFAIPIKSNNERRDAVACSLLIRGDADQIGSMRITILYKDFRRLEKCSIEDVNSLARSLAGHGTPLMDESAGMAVRRSTPRRDGP